MPTAELNKEQILIDDGKDSVVIVKVLGDIPGGRTLDVSGVSSEVNVIKAGHILVQNDTTGAVSPMPVSGSAYGTKPAGTSYIGVLKASVLKKDPRAAIMTIGQMNAAASPYPNTAVIKAALPLIQFLNARIKEEDIDESGESQS